MSKRSLSPSPKIPQPKSSRLNSCNSSQNRGITVLISNISQFQELVRIIVGVSNTAEFSISPGMLNFKVMSSANISCCHAQFVCETPGFRNEAGSGPYFVDLNLLELCLSTKLYTKMAGSETLLQFVIIPDEKITIAMVNPNTEAQIPYLCKHKLRLLDASPVGLSMESLVYDVTVRFSITDLKAVLDQFRQFKFVHLTFDIFTDDLTNSFALRISASNINHSSKHTFYCFKPRDSDIVCASSTFAENEGSIKNSSLVLKLSQSFYCSHLFKVVKAMNDHYVKISFNDGLPLCVRYDFTSHSYLQYFLCSLAEDMDADAIANMPISPDEE